MKKGIVINGQKMKAARMATGLSLRALGGLVRRSAVCMSLLENGHCRASEQTLSRLALELGMPAELLKKVGKQ